MQQLPQSIASELHNRGKTYKNILKLLKKHIKHYFDVFFLKDKKLFEKHFKKVVEL